MAKRVINTGTAQNPTGDSLKNAFTKVNDNFTELYNALGLDQDTLNIGAFEFTGSTNGVATMTTTDSSAILIDQTVTVGSDLTVGGDILPSVANGGDLGSSSKPWRSLYVSNSTIYLGGTALAVNQSGQLTVGGSQVGANPTWASVTGKPTIPTLTSQLTNDSGFLTTEVLNNGLNADLNGSVFADDSTLLVDGVAGKIVGDVDSNTVTANTVNTINIVHNGLLIGSEGTYGYIDIPNDANSNLYGGLRIANQDGPVTIKSFLQPNGIVRDWTFGTDGSLTIPGDIRSEREINIDINLADSTLYRWRFGEDGELTFPNGTSQSTAGISASSTDTLTNKTINIQAGQGNVFQIQGNSITSYSGSGAVLALTSMPTFSGMNVNNSSLSIDGGSGSYYWAPTFADGTGTIHKAGVYKSASNSNNALFSFGANSTGNMSVAVEGSVFIGNALPANNGGLNTNYGGWLVVQAGAKFGGDLNTIGNFILDTPGNYVRFGDGTTQTTAADFGYLDLDKDTIKGTAGYQYTFATDGYFTNSTSSESLSYFFVTYNTTNTNIAAGWTVVGGTANTTVSSVTYPVAGYPGVIQVNLTQPASSTAGFYPVTVTSPDRLRVEIQPNPGTSDKFSFQTSGITFPNGAQILKTVGVDDSITIGATGTTGTTTFNGSGFFNSDTFFHRSIQEKFSSLQDATGVVTHNCENGHVFYHTSPDANWTVNLTNFSLITNYATAITIIISQGGTGYYPNALQIGGAAQTINWQGNATPTPSSNRVDVVTFSIFLTGSGYTVLGQLTGF